MIYDSLYICVECILGLQILKLVSVYWIRRPVSAYARRVQRHAEMFIGY